MFTLVDILVHDVCSLEPSFETSCCVEHNMILHVYGHQLHKTKTYY